MNKAETAIHECQSKDKEKQVKRNREDKKRKKDDKSVDHVLKVLSSLETTEEKLGAMCQKYAEMFNDHRILQNAAKLAEKKNSILQKEKEQLQAEHSKAILTRSRLENLCRELQRQNKAVKEECMLKIREEEEKKREVATKFQSTLTELGNLLAQNNDKNAKLRDDNLDMTTKLKNVCEQYEKKEQHVEKMAKQMHLEMQLANTKLAKAKMEMALEKEALLRDNQQLLLELKEYKKQLEEMKTSEVALRNQIQLYNDKYDEFHKALLQSNDAIGSFKQEMERMAKQIRKLEKETVAWKRRYETTHRTLLQMTEEKIKSDETASVSERRLTALQGLCRTLQAQCNHLRGVVKAQAAASPSDEGLINSARIELDENNREETNKSISELDQSVEALELAAVDETLTVLVEHQTQADSAIIDRDNSSINELQEISQPNGAVEDIEENSSVEEIAAAASIEISKDKLVLGNGVDSTEQVNSEEIEISMGSAKVKHEPAASGECFAGHICGEPQSVPVSCPLPADPSEVQSGEQVLTDDAVALEEEITEKFQLVHLPPLAHQSVAKKNKGKRKKNGPASIKSP
ncbi:beta-taxilin-like isoform X2 [Rhodnius prolixus]|uniref:beta-taxilin-like isoform X2 n=1 Tax=Rhodnius prolixus TaxID=13249 RepID=UPI003D18C1C8